MKIYYIKETSTNLQNDLEGIITLLSSIMIIFSDEKKIKNDENTIKDCIKDYINDLKIKINLMVEKEKVIGN